MRNLISVLSVKCVSLKLVPFKATDEHTLEGSPISVISVRWPLLKMVILKKAIREDTLLPRVVDAVQALNLKAADDDPSCTKALIRTLPLMLDRDPYHA